MGDLLRLAVLEAENIELRRLLRERTDELIKERIAHKDCCKKEDITNDNDGTQEEGQA